MFILWWVLAAKGVVDTKDFNSDLAFALVFAISMLVVSCPCAFALAVPCPVMVAAGTMLFCSLKMCLYAFVLLRN